VHGILKKVNWKHEVRSRSKYSAGYASARFKSFYSFFLNVEAASRRQLPNTIDSKPKCNEKDVVD